jgi:uncharacterized membrane protein YjjP (DUF1212 family)
MKSDNELKSIARFIAEYATCLLGSGVHISRVIRNSKRMGEAFCLEVRLIAFHKSIVLTVCNIENDAIYTEVVNVPALPVSFEYNSELSSLSWEAYDKHLSLAELQEKYNQIRTKPKMSPRLILLLVGFGNASFCRLFGGDWKAVGIVFMATLVGFFIRQQMQRLGISHFMVFTVSAFISSMCASTSLLFESTPEIAIATSVLYLIPGVPLINGVIDIVEGHILAGCSRLIEASLLVICVAVGLSLPLLLFYKHSLL